MAAVAFFFWARLLMMLQLTETFGPMIEIVIHMMYDLVIFFGLFAIQIITFAAVGVLLFGDVPEYDDIISTSLMFFSYALGSFDLSIYDNQTSSRAVAGIIYSCIVLIVNMLVLMNFLIALMQDTYVYYRRLKRGLLYKSIVYAIPNYKYDSTYGCLIALPPPFNVLNLIILPWFLVSGFGQVKK